MFGVGGHSGLVARHRQRSGCGKAYGKQQQKKKAMNIYLCLEKEGVKNIAVKIGWLLNCGQS